MERLDQAYDMVEKLYPCEGTIQTFQDKSSQPRLTFDEMTTELVIRKAKRLRNTRRCHNMLYNWRQTLRNCARELACDFSVAAMTWWDVWVEGLIIYYCTELRQALQQLDGELQPPSWEAPTTATDKEGSRLTPSLLQQRIDSVREHLTPSVCESPCFLRALQLLAELRRTFAIARALAIDNITEDIVSVLPANSPAVPFERDYWRLLGNHFSTPQWHYYLVALLFGALRNLSLEVAEPRGEERHLPAIDPSHLRDALAEAQELLRTIFCETQRQSHDDMMTLLFLNFVQMFFFQTFDMEVIHAYVSTGEKAQENAQLARSTSQWDTQPLHAFLSEHLPRFLADEETLLGDLAAVKRALIASVILPAAFKMDEGLATSGQAAAWKEADASTNLLYRAFRVLLQVLLPELLLGHSNDGDDCRKASSAAGHPSDGDETGLSCAQKTALERIVALGQASMRLRMPKPPVLSTWNFLYDRPQPSVEVRIGAVCFHMAMKTTLDELMANMLSRMDLTPSTPAPVKENVVLTFYRYLLRSEPAFRALVESHGQSATWCRLFSSCEDDFGGAQVSGPRASESLYCAAVEKALRAVYTNNVISALTLPIVNSLHIYLLHLQEGGDSGAGRGASARAPHSAAAPPTMGPPLGPANAARRAVVLRGREDMRTATRLVACIRDTDLFCKKYVEQLVARLLHRPPPHRMKDKESDAIKQEAEVTAFESLKECLGDTDDVHQIRKLLLTYRPQYVTERVNSIVGSSTSEVKLVVNEMDWREWTETFCPLDMPGSLSAESRALNEDGYASGRGYPSPNTALPFPHDLLEAMQAYQLRFQTAHPQLSLSWRDTTYERVAMEVSFPKIASGPITIRATLQHVRLILAIAEYGREGVTWNVLACRAKKEADHVRAWMKLCVRDGLLRVWEAVAADGFREEWVAMNYDLEDSGRPSQGSFTYWPRPPIINDLSVASYEAVLRDREHCAQARMVQVLKAARQVSYDDLFVRAKELVANKFELTPRIMKNAIEQLIGKGWIERLEDNRSTFRYTA